MSKSVKLRRNAAATGTRKNIKITSRAGATNHIFLDIAKFARDLLSPCIAYSNVGSATSTSFRKLTMETGQHLDLTGYWAGYAAVGIFILAYALVIAEENLRLRKSKPVTVAAGLIWALVAIAYTGQGQPTAAAQMMRHNLLEFAEVMLFLLAAMTYINTLEERNVFKALRAWLLSAGFSLHAI